MKSFLICFLLKSAFATFEYCDDLPLWDSNCADFGIDPTAWTNLVGIGSIMTDYDSLVTSTSAEANTDHLACGVNFVSDDFNQAQLLECKQDDFTDGVDQTFSNAYGGLATSLMCDTDKYLDGI